MKTMDPPDGKKIFGLSRNVFSMGLVSFFNDLATEMIFPFIPIFLTSVLGASVGIVGIIEGMADALANFTKIISGVLSDRLKKKKIFLTFGYGLSALSKPLLALSTHWGHVFGLRLMDRAGKGLREPPRDVLITFSTPKEETGRAFGFHRAMDTLGASLGPLLGAFLLPFLGHELSYSLRVLFLVSAIAGACAVLTIIFFIRDLKSSFLPSGVVQAAVPPNKSLKFSLKDFSPSFYLFLFAVTIFSLGNISQAFFFLRANQLGIALVALPVLYFTSNIITTLLDVPFGLLSDRVGRKEVLFFGYLTFAVMSFGFAWAHSSLAAWIFFLLWGVFIAFNEGPTRAMVRDLVEEEKRGRGYGLLSVCLGLGLLLGNLIFGFLWDFYGSQKAFLWSVLTSVIALAVMLFLRYDAKATR